MRDRALLFIGDYSIFFTCNKVISAIRNLLYQLIDFKLKLKCAIRNTKRHVAYRLWTDKNNNFKMDAYENTNTKLILSQLVTKMIVITNLNLIA